MKLEESLALILCKGRQAVLKSTKNNKGKCSAIKGVEPIEIATFGIIKLLGTFAINIFKYGY